MSITELERLVVSIEANTSNIDKRLKELQSGVDLALDGVEDRTSKMTGFLGAQFASLGRITRNLTVGFAALQAVRFGENVFKDFDAITERARSLGIVVGDDLVESMRESRTAWTRAWTEMEVAVAPVVALVARLVELGTLLPRGVAAAVSDISRAQTGAEFMARDTASPLNGQTAASPFQSNLDFVGTQAMRQKIADEQKKLRDDIANFDQEQGATQLQIANESASGIAAIGEKIKAEHKAVNDAILLNDQDLAEQQLQIDNENFAATHARGEKIKQEALANADAVKKFQDDQAAPLRRLNEQFIRTLAFDIADFGDAMDRAGGKFGKAVAGMIVDIGKLIIKLEIAKIIETSLGSGGGVGSGPILGGVGSFFGSLFGGARAGGGPVFPGTSYPVGEKGPEIFVPNVPGRIIPNGGGSSSNYFDLRGAVVTQDLLNQMNSISRRNSAMATAQAVKQSDSRFAQNYMKTLRDVA